jgi:hypothetical protein
MAFRLPSSVRWQTLLLAALLVGGAIHAFRSIAYRHAPGCASYRPVGGYVLIAHAAGGMSDRMYANDIAALDRAYGHGLRIFEMDFHELGFGIIRAGHDPSDMLDPRGAWVSDVLAWLRAHPDTRLITDMKTDNVHALTTLAAEAPDLRDRIMPFVYQKSEYAAVRALGFRPPIFAAFATHDRDWLAFANSHAFTAVALPHRFAGDVRLIRHPTIMYTFDVVPTGMGLTGLMTDCLMPVSPHNG